MKKVILPLIMLIAGAIAGYFVCENMHKGKSGNSTTKDASDTSSNSLTSNGTSFKSVEGITAKEIPKDKAKELIDRYETDVIKTNSPSIMMTNREPLRGFFIDVISLRRIFNKLNSNSKFEGISLYLAKHPDFMAPGDKSNNYTIVFAGALRNANKQTGDSEYINDDTYEYVDTCPTHCGDLGNGKK